ncbi:MAG TPA: DUF1800 domain-containing protein [Bryobacteraceae bacterium]|jgi:uncharacterized protein (DUF1800 family)|nr:DUF1800 domain-containing protein [Bryobacteraceae bacterium]
MSKVRRYLLPATLMLPIILWAQPPRFSNISPREAARILEQGTWGPTPSEISALQPQGLKNWLAAQFAAPISTYADQPLLNSSGKGNTNLVPVEVQFFQNMVSGPDQLRQRVAFALSEIWVVSEVEVGNAQAFPPLMRLFQNDAFGNYETLMNDVTLNPGMGRMLNMVDNNKANPAKGTAANENYARELMQLFTLGLLQLNNDGTPALDSSGNPIPIYAQTDVTNNAKAFTGWTYALASGAAPTKDNPEYFLSPMVPLETQHDTTAKTILGANLPANQTAEQDLQQALHIIFEHPNLPPFVCKQLIQHLVTSNPNPEYVDRVAHAFINNGSGVRGDLKAVVTAILTDPDARGADGPWDTHEGDYGHLREPALMLGNLLRGLSGTVGSASTVYNVANSLGQYPFYALSVFSYFSPQYQIGRNEYAPEFQIYSTQTASTRINIINSVIYGSKLDSATTFDLSAFTALGGSPQALIALINQVFFHSAMSSNLNSALQAGITAQSTPTAAAQAALYLALTSGEFQVAH